VAQPGSAAVLGTAGRWFESSRPDQVSFALCSTRNLSCSVRRLVRVRKSDGYEGFGQSDKYLETVTQRIAGNLQRKEQISLGMLQNGNTQLNTWL
jgi:hypothetical protein